MTAIGRVALFVFILALLAPAALAHERQTEHTLKLAPGEKPGTATIGDMAWLAGHWRGEGLGGFVEEMWTPPRDGVMLGMFRLVRDGHPEFYELMAIVEEEQSLVLRVKHFNPDMTGWEEKDETVDFPFVARAGGIVHFAGVAFEAAGDTLTIFLALDGEDGRVREESFRYTRVAPERTQK